MLLIARTLLVPRTGVNTVNVVRDRPGLQALTDVLTALGATVVTTEEELKAHLKEAGLPPPALALNCVGGSSGTAVAKALGSDPHYTQPSSAYH